MASEIREIVPVTSTSDRYATVIGMVTDHLTSEHSRRAYKRAIRDYLIWHEMHLPHMGLCRYSVAHYLAYIRDTLGMSLSTINLRMSALRKLAEEAHEHDLIDEVTAIGITRLKGKAPKGVRRGNWLTLDDAQRLLNMPDISTLRGLRDRAMLAVMLGCGLRRDEMVNLSLSHIQQREGRWAIIDIEGKGKKVRSVPMAAWVKAAIDAWTDAASIKGGYVFKPVRKNGTLASWEPLHPQTIYDTLEVYTQRLGIPDFAPHDARRTFAKLARKGGASLEQIQLSLGHASVQTTERYLGTEQDFGDAPSDHVGLRID